MTIIEFSEWCESREKLYLDDDLISSLEKINEHNKTIDLVPVKNHKCKLKGRSWVGVTKISCYTVKIKPKIGNLKFFKILEYTEDLSGLKLLERIDIDEGDDLVDLVAKLFAQLVKDIIEYGINKNYVLLEEKISSVRGRILIAKNIKNITQEKIWCAYDEMNHDTLENQILLYCSKTLFELVVDIQTRDELEQIIHLLQKEGVSDVPIEQYHMTMVQYQRFNKHYENALKICELVLRSSWYNDSTDNSVLSGFGFLYNMNTLFEKFILKSVGEIISQQFKVKKNKQVKLLSEVDASKTKNESKSKNVVRPDVVIQDYDEKIRLIIDAKYKENIDANDFYQSLAYSLAYDCPVILLHPQFNEEEIYHYKLAESDHSMYERVSIFTNTVNFEKEDSDNYIASIQKSIKKTVIPILTSQENNSSPTLQT